MDYDRIYFYKIVFIILYKNLSKNLETMLIYKIDCFYYNFSHRV